MRNYWYCLSVVLLLLCCTLQGQTEKYFWQYYGTDSLQETSDRLIRFNDDLYIASGVEFDPIGNGQKEMVWAVNGKGELQWVRSFGDYSAPNNAWQFNITPERHINFVMHSEPFATHFLSLYLIELDSLGQTQKYISLMDTTSNWSNIAFHIVNNQNGSGYVMAKSATDTIGHGLPKPNICLIDTAGNYIWHRIFSYLPSYGRVNYITPAADGGYYLSGFTNYVFEGRGYSDCLLLKTDSEGREEWHSIKDFADIEGLGDTYEINDSTFVGIIGYTNWVTINGIVEEKERCGIITQFDREQNMQWTSPCLCENRGIRRLLHLTDGSWVGMGEYLSDEPYWLRIELFKLDATGNVLWQRHYGTDERLHYYAGSVAELSDGSFVMSGRVTGPRTLVGASSDALIFKVNCLGLQTEPEADFTITANSWGTVAFENHSQYVYEDSIGGGHYVWDFGDGTSLSAKEAAHSYTRSGTYEVRLQAIVCQDTATFTQKVAINVPAPAVYDMLLTNTQSSGGLMEVLYDIPEAGEHALVLYDVLGREVARVAVASATRGQAVVSLAAVASGMYIIALTQSDKVILSRKVLVI
ncbi:MAG: PKD domain-containing protein [Bacteroidetes bacterium]|nr:PKD domain-containing protein [Bacteroidota bacterium]